MQEAVVLDLPAAKLAQPIEADLFDSEAALRAETNQVHPDQSVVADAVVNGGLYRALHVRNLILNWLVILPALCLALFTVKIVAVGAFWLSLLGTDYTRYFAIAGVVLMVLALRFALVNRPSSDPCTIAESTAPRQAGHDDACGMKAPRDK